MPTGPSLGSGRSIGDGSAQGRGLSEPVRQRRRTESWAVTSPRDSTAYRSPAHSPVPPRHTPEVVLGRRTLSARVAVALASDSPAPWGLLSPIEKPARFRATVRYVLRTCIRLVVRSRSSAPSYTVPVEAPSSGDAILAHDVSRFRSCSTPLSPRR